jgi:hypothetical protein
LSKQLAIRTLTESGSGSSTEDFQEAISYGVVKVNLEYESPIYELHVKHTLTLYTIQHGYAMGIPVGRERLRSREEGLPHGAR